MSCTEQNPTPLPNSEPLKGFTREEKQSEVITQYVVGEKSRREILKYAVCHGQRG
jgi:hypothetical protein